MTALIERPFWKRKILTAWEQRPLVWLHGSRRAGKTSLSKMLGESIYLNCDLPSVIRRLQDPESFYQSLLPGSLVIFDKVHRLPDPSQVLKIGTDEYPSLRLLATGSSSLDATRKFSDSLTGRKTSVYLTPVLWEETQENFSIRDFDHRLFRGGLPEPLMASQKDPAFFSEWIDSFYALDIQALFNIRNREGYIRLMHLIYRSSGNLIEYNSLSKSSGLSRPTVTTYLKSLQIADNIYLVPPFHGGGKREITARPKCYAFDTGFVTFIKGWEQIREEDRGILWEHLVLDNLRTRNPGSKIHYWRDISGREIDFIIPQDKGHVDVFECKINPEHFSVQTLAIFRSAYPNGRNVCICPFLKEPYSVNIQGITVEFSGGMDILN